jgi:hypothetical protein
MDPPRERRKARPRAAAPTALLAWPARRRAEALPGGRTRAGARRKVEARGRARPRAGDRILRSSAEARWRRRQMDPSSEGARAKLLAARPAAATEAAGRAEVVPRAEPKRGGERRRAMDPEAERRSRAAARRWRRTGSSPRVSRLDNAVDPAGRTAAERVELRPAVGPTLAAARPVARLAALDNRPEALPTEAGARAPVAAAARSAVAAAGRPIAVGARAPDLPGAARSAEPGPAD